MSWHDLFDLDRLIAGFWFFLGGVLAVVVASIVRSLSTAGGSGLVYLGKVAFGWLRYRQGIDDTINVTLNTTRDGVLMIDTWVDEHRLDEIWHNAWHVIRLQRMAQLCTEDDPLIKFRYRKNGRWHLKSYESEPRHNEYRKTYDRIVNKIAAYITNQNSLDYSLGLHFVPHRYVVALTFERLRDRRAQHFRVMVINERELLDFPQDGVSVMRPEHETRLRTLRAIARQYKEEHARNPDHPERFGILVVWRPADGRGDGRPGPAPLPYGVR
jgi:hypothetical protein